MKPLGLAHVWIGALALAFGIEAEWWALTAFGGCIVAAGLAVLMMDEPKP